MVLLAFILMQTAYANLDVTPSGFEVDLIINEEKTQELTLTNNYNFTIYNITAVEVDEISFPQIALLEQNTSTKVNITMLSDEIHPRETKELKLFFFYLTEIEENPTNHYWEITDTEYNPLEKTIEIGDVVIFENNGTVMHTVTADGIVDLEIQANSTLNHQFNTAQNFTFHDETIHFQANINIIPKSNQQLVHNQDYDTAINLHVLSKYRETTLEITLLDEDFDIPYNGDSEGSIKLKNTGNQTAKNVELSGSWISFNENDFNLEPEEINYVTFTISPDISETDDTNKTHIKKINIKGDNFDTIEKELSVYIPYHKFYEGTQDQDIDWNDVTSVCEFIPSFPACQEQTPEVIYINNDSVKLRTLNISEEEIKEELLANKQLAEELLRIENQRKQDTSDTKTNLESLETDVSQIAQDFNAEKDRRETATAIIIVVVIGIIVIGLAIAGGFYYVKFYKKKQQEDNLNF